MPDPRTEIKQMQKEKEDAVKQAVKTQNKLTGSDDKNNDDDDFYNQKSGQSEDDS